MPFPSASSLPAMARALVLVVLLILAAIVAFGPRATVDPAIEAPPLPERPADLDAYLAEAERRFDDITPGTEKTIVWADSSRRRTPLSVVYLHGFSATRQETAPLSDTVAARLGANLYYARLTGHGRGAAPMGTATATDWLRDAREAYAIGRLLGDRVVLIGTSTGGTLALWLATRPDVTDVEALVLISPNFRPYDPNSRLLAWPWSRLIARMVVGSDYEWEPANEQQRRFWTTRYPSSALTQMMALCRLVDRTGLDAVKAPALVFYSRNDQVVSSELVEIRFTELGSARKRLHEVEDAAGPSYHVLAGDILSPHTTGPLVDEIVAFVRQAPGASPLP